MHRGGHSRYSVNAYELRVATEIAERAAGSYNPSPDESQRVVFIANCSDLTNAAWLDQLSCPDLRLHVGIDTCQFCRPEVRLCTGHACMHILGEQFSSAIPIVMAPRMDMCACNADGAWCLRFLAHCHGAVMRYRDGLQRAGRLYATESFPKKNFAIGSA